ncbi:MAG TPA: Wzz/FepE/Etk N-terminal domain-containing protein [Bacteroidales bacterium]|nr:Wzz/FepE/Etk N-terminal domain-containing protein [Bacteroidales bacterium]HPI29708.1 Wzz/FepE/Etk N-terminal domain-containing protein [Bacteroidales bacterium]HQN15697.1 Wzz/FepE/Etk N-terminal domain-containing protein [Bacteroidales bacterium]HQP15146.1 Wzz/FepE/Etk N-terminal domain-containing protein [Bacteroidales bacterium]
MAEQDIRQANFNTTNFFFFLYKWRKPLIIICLVAAIVSSVISLLITPKYKSSVILFPASTNAISKALLADNYGGKLDILEFGEEAQTEQLLQILSSNEIRSRVIKKFNLMEHYEIENDSKYKMTRLFEEYNSNITYRRTEYMAVEITVLDKDPQLAADIANYISDQLDSVKNKMQKERAIKAFQIVETEYKKLQSDIKSLEDSLTVLRKMGVNDYETQAEAYNTQLAIALSKNNREAVRAIEERLQLLGDYGSAYVSLRDELELEKKQLSAIKAKYEEAKVDATQDLPSKFVVDKAFKAERKSYPVRWLIVMLSVVSVFFISIMTLIIIENFSKKKFPTNKPEDIQSST